MEVVTPESRIDHVGSAVAMVRERRRRGSMDDSQCALNFPAGHLSMAISLQSSGGSALEKS
jgi:hypothetical protein